MGPTDVGPQRGRKDRPFGVADIGTAAAGLAVGQAEQRSTLVHGPFQVGQGALGHGLAVVQAERRGKTQAQGSTHPEAYEAGFVGEERLHCSSLPAYTAQIAPSAVASYAMLRTCQLQTTQSHLAHSVVELTVLNYC